MNQQSSAIIIAAGRGRRLGNHTDDRPKCMVPVAGRPILHHQLESLASIGVTDVTIIRGYRGALIDPGPFAQSMNLRFVENPEWERNNILVSLMYAADIFSARDSYVSYSDIVFARSVAATLATTVKQSLNKSAALDAALIVDREWQAIYEGRTDHPLPEAELCAIDTAKTRIVRVGKQTCSIDEAAGEFIGLAHFSQAGARRLVSTYEKARQSNGGQGFERPFVRAATLRNAYLSDGITALAADGANIVPAFIDGQWREIDTQQDLQRAELALPQWM